MASLVTKIVGAGGLFSRMLRFYRHYLSKYLIFRIVRELVSIIYRTAYHAYCYLMPMGSVGRFELLRFGSYSGNHLVARTQIFSAESTNIPSPVFLNVHDIKISSPRHASAIELASIDVLDLHDVSVVGGTDFILADNVALAPDRFIEFSDTCPANIFGVTSINHSQRSLKLFLTGQPIKIDSGISLLGQNTANYAHWLTETLPKLATLGAFPQYEDLPLLVDSGLHKNIYSSISLVAGKKRKLILVGRWQKVTVQRLVSVTQAGYEPYIPHGLFKPGLPKLVNVFSASALAALKAAVLHVVPPKFVHGRKKIFLYRSDRSNNLRSLQNWIDIESMLRARGYAILDPAKMSFIEQVQVCRSAEIIVAPIGAALANMIFASNDCKILALSPFYEGANYYFYANLSVALKLDFSYLLGTQSDQRGHPAHRSYSINISELERALGQLEYR